MMSDKPDSETVLAQVDGEDFSTDRLTVEGQPRLGSIVEVAYQTNAGGAWRTDSPTTVRGELMYVEVGTGVGEARGEWDGSVTIVVRDSERDRGVAVPLKVDGVGQYTAKSLAAARSRYGRRLGGVQRVTFTEEQVDAHAPVIAALRAVDVGDTLMVNGAEYGVQRAWGSGPSERPDGYVAELTRPDGGQWKIRASAAYDSPRFSGPDCEYGEYLELDVSSVRPGRFTERWSDEVRGRENTEDTTDAFPAPHGHREGERVTVTLASEDGEDTVSGTVTDVRYFTREETSLFSDPREKDPETKVELDDGRRLVLNTGTKYIKRMFGDWADYDEPAYRTVLVTEPEGEDGEREYSNPYAVDISGEDAGGDEDEDGGEELETDGGQPTKVELDSEWYFTGSVDRECVGCGHTPTRLSRVREVFGDPLCSSCFHERRRAAPGGDADGEVMTDGGRPEATDSDVRDAVERGERLMTDGGLSEDPVERWGGAVREYTHGEMSREFYVPPEPVRGGPLDVYLSGFDPEHFVDGPTYRDAMDAVWGPDEDPGERPEVRSLCGGVDVYVAHEYGLKHYLDTLATTEWTEPRPLMNGIHDRHPEAAYSMIPGSPVTVLGTACGNCLKSARARDSIEDIQDALVTLAACGQDPGVMTDGGSNTPDAFPSGTPEVGERVVVRYTSHQSGGGQEREGEVVNVDVKDTGHIHLTISEDTEDRTLMVTYSAGDGVGVVTTQYTATRNTTADTTELRTIGSLDEVETVATRAMTDGGQDPDTLANAVSTAVAGSHLSRDAISVNVGEVDGEVTVQGSGPTTREDWVQLRAHITDVLDAEGFQYRANDAWGFVEVTGREDGEVMTDGGEPEGGDGPGEDPHSDVKVAVGPVDAVMMARTAGDEDEYVAVWRYNDATEDELEKYRLVMDLGDYTEVDPGDALGVDGRAVGGDDVVLDVWKPKDLITDGGVAGRRDTVNLETVVARILAGFGESARRLPSHGDVVVQYHVQMWGRLADALDVMGLDYRREGRTVAGPEIGDALGTVRVIGFRDGGEGDE